VERAGEVGGARRRAGEAAPVWKGPSGLKPWHERIALVDLALRIRRHWLFLLVPGKIGSAQVDDVAGGHCQLGA
jgi:hypothetical protein